MTTEDTDLNKHETDGGVEDELDKFDSEMIEIEPDISVNKEYLKEEVEYKEVKGEVQHNRCNVYSGNI